MLKRQQKNKNKNKNRQDKHLTSESEKYESDWAALHNQSHRFLIVSTDGLAINSYYWICHSEKRKKQQEKTKK